MSSPARAIAWQFSQRHRWGLVALAVYLFALAIIKLVIIATGQPVSLDSPERFAVVVVVPLTATFTYFLAVFSFGFSGDLGARRSMYPARMFTLPVTTAALAGWPMLYGTAAISLLWLALRLFVIWPSGIDVPVIWPALMGAVLLAWTQALTWMPYGLPGLRVIVAVLWLALIDAVVLLAIHFKAPEPLVVAFLAPQLPLAYVAACYAVARALKHGSSGGGTAGRCRRWWACCCRSNWLCSSSPATTRRYSSFPYCSACCSLHRSWPRSPPRRCANRVRRGAMPTA